MYIHRYIYIYIYIYISYNVYIYIYSIKVIRAHVRAPLRVPESESLLISWIRVFTFILILIFKFTFIFISIFILIFYFFFRGETRLQLYRVWGHSPGSVYYIMLHYCIHTRHILPPSEIDLGLCLAAFTSSEGQYIFHRIG